MHDLTRRPARGLISVGGKVPTLATAARMVKGDDIEDWVRAQGVVTAPDRAFLVGRYCHAGLPANSNGYIFKTEQLPDDLQTINHSPLDMLHRPERIVGTHAAARIVYPRPDMNPAAYAALEATQLQRLRAGERLTANAGAYDDSPYVQVIGAVWSYHYPNEAKKIAEAYDQGLLFLSMSGLPEEISCVTCGHTSPWQGQSSPAYCGHMQGVGPKLFDNTLFLGGAVIIPPISPGWSDSSVTDWRRFADADLELADQTYRQVEAMAAGNGTPAQLESITAQLMMISNGGPTSEIRAAHRAMHAAGLAELRSDVPPPNVLEALRPELAEGDTAVLVDDLRTGNPQSAATIETLVDVLLDPATAADTRAALGGDVVASWAEEAWRGIVRADLAAMAASLTTAQRQKWADEGVAMPDGSYPIPSIAYLKKAMMAFGRASNMVATKRHIMKRARALNAPQSLILRASRLGSAKAGLADDGEMHTGIIIALSPPIDIAAQIAAVSCVDPEEDTCDADEIHLTLAFLGNSEIIETGDDEEEPSPDFGSLQEGLDVKAFQHDTLSAALAVFAANEKPLTATTSGLGHFDQGDIEVTYVSVDCPGLSELRARLVTALDGAGIPYSTLHGFAPHITLSYAAPGGGPTEAPTGLTWTVDSIELWWAGEHVAVSLG